jgi:colanic acid/amylovoran biosynthesis glycosyltransferase
MGDRGASLKPTQGTQMTVDGRTLLLYAPVPLFSSDQGYLLEDQATNGLRLWAENFERVIAMYPVETGTPPSSWIPLRSSGIDMNRVEIVALPTAYRPDRFLRHYWKVRRQIAGLIDRAEYLTFAVGGLFGDWGSVAASEAYKKGRRFAVWADRVESEVVRYEARTAPTLKGRLRASLTHGPMAMLERTTIRRATLGLFHGAETYARYAPFARAAEIVHDIHLHERDRIPLSDLEEKKRSVFQEPLKICYIGRAHPMKGTEDWIDVMAELKAAGVDFRATWLGDGERLPAMQTQVKRLGLDQQVTLPGFVRDREAILKILREAHVFMFCHKTPESPRNLIEALVSGTPLVGYDSPFPRDLISVNGGGVLAPKDDVKALASSLVALAGARGQLASLIDRAYLDGAPFNDAAVFKHRSDVIRAHL